MVSKPKVYLETSFISYMVGKDTTNVKIASEQAWTRKWWAEIAPACDVFASNFVVEEAKDGAEDYVARRLEFLKGIPLLSYDREKVKQLAAFVCPQILKPSTYFEYMELEG